MIITILYFIRVHYEFSRNYIPASCCGAVYSRGRPRVLVRIYIRYYNIIRYKIRELYYCVRRGIFKRLERKQKNPGAA